MENKKLGLDEALRPNAKMIGEDGNIFNQLEIASKALRKAGFKDEVDEMFKRVTSSGNYEEALGIITEYVNPMGDDISMEDDYDMRMNNY